MRRLILPALLFVAALVVTFPHAASADGVFRPGEVVVKRQGGPATIERTKTGETLDQAMSRVCAEPGVESVARNPIARMTQATPACAVAERPRALRTSPAAGSSRSGTSTARASVNAAAAWGNVAKVGPHRRARDGRRGARHRRRLPQRRPLQALPGLRPGRLRARLRLRRRRHPPRRRERPRHPRREHDRRGRQQRRRPDRPRVRREDHAASACSTRSARATCPVIARGVR